MSTEITLPRIGFGMTEGTIAAWLVADGAPVTAGQAIYTMESDKTVQEVESPATGVLRILAKAGQAYPVGVAVGIIE